MPFIKTVPIDEATGQLKAEYDAALQRAGKVFNIVSLQSLRPDVLHAGILIYKTLMHKASALTRAQKEMIAVIVSKLNECFY